jgi:hypothetical protein
MKVNFKFLVLTLMLFLLATPIFASNAIQELNFNDPSSVVLWLMPLLTLGGVWLLRKLPFISGSITLFLVPLVSIGITWLTSIITGDASWIAQILAGVGSVFLHQLSEHLSKQNKKKVHSN